jgi:hypothetical protein
MKLQRLFQIAGKLMDDPARNLRFSHAAFSQRRSAFATGGTAILILIIA